MSLKFYCFIKRCIVPMDERIHRIDTVGGVGNAKQGSQLGKGAISQGQSLQYRNGF